MAKTSSSEKNRTRAASGGGTSGDKDDGKKNPSRTTSSGGGNSKTKSASGRRAEARRQSSKTASAGAGAKGSSRRSSRSSSGKKASDGKRASASRANLRYKVRQHVVYPLHGVGQVVKIEDRPFQGETLLYYIIYIDVSDMTVMVPVDKSDELGIRPIVDKKEALRALKLISEKYEPVPSDWKVRYQMNLDLLKSGSVIDIAKVVRTLYHRSKIKELPILERKLFDSALRLLIDEVSYSLGKGKEEVEEMIFQSLESAVG